MHNKSAFNKCSKFVCRKIYVCHHSDFNKISKTDNKRGRSKNTQCNAMIDIKIKLTTKDTKKKDKFVKDGLPAIIKINNDHNHNISTAEALSFLKPSKECRLQFENYFNDGLGISESIRMHESKLELEFGINSDELANAMINPKYRTIRHWYDVWKENNLGSSNYISVLQKLEEKKKYYEDNGIIVRYTENPFAILVVTPIMKRAHQLPFSKDIAFVDSTSSCDVQCHSITFMLAPCGVGAVP
ncbi:SWIM-type domain-containing protein, partial [Aphis craccivora]